MVSQPHSTILLIEDDSNFTDLFQKWFSHQPFSLEVALDGKEGIERAVQLQPALIVVTDLAEYSTLNGIEVHQKLRAHTRTQKIPIILLLAEETLSDSAQLPNGPYDAILRKPLDFDQFSTALHHFLPRSFTAFSAVTPFDYPVEEKPSE